MEIKNYAKLETYQKPILASELHLVLLLRRKVRIFSSNILKAILATSEPRKDRKGDVWGTRVVGRREHVGRLVNESRNVYKRNDQIANT